MSDDERDRDEDPRSLQDIIAAAREVAPVLSDEDLARETAEIAAREQRRNANDHEKTWRKIIPPRYQWAHPRAVELPSRAFPVRPTADGRGIEHVACAAALARISAHDGPIVAFGGPGTGKTSLLAAALRARFDAKTNYLFFMGAHRLGVCRIQHAAGQGEAQLVIDAMRARLLLLDDVGNERQTANNAIPDVILERHERNLPTWVTTGLGREDLVKLYGGGVVRRIFERALVIECRRPEATS